MAYPLLIVLTPVRNEAWVLRAFLEATSLWADYIIVADQMSTDGSREIARQYPKVILVDNDRGEMHQAATRRLLFEESKKIKGDKILFTLDADEFLSGDFIHTEDWRKILESRPNDAFCWRWMYLKEDDPGKYSTQPEHYYWAVHESKELWEGEFPDNFIHEWRLPWPPDARKFVLNGFHSLHFARVNRSRQRNKERFYQVSTLALKPTANPIKLYRQYHIEDGVFFDVPDNAYSFYEMNGIDIWNLMDLKDEGQYYTDEVLRYFGQYGTKRFAMLDIWDSEWMEKNGITDPRNGVQKVVQAYLKKTMKRRGSLIFRAIDKFLQLIYR